MAGHEMNPLIESTDGGQRYVMRLLPYRTVDNVIAVPCRELLLTDDVRQNAAALAAQIPAVENRVGDTLADTDPGR